ncbi:30S ribosomal protein S17 [Brachybacterium sp. UNK5269]|uniref:30S ribosomal protein S17 n=1 Tax=Brachybacterium sp. UNK5269 TaxID=3408576 RepID=UPI003BAE4377
MTENTQAANAAAEEHVAEGAHASSSERPYRKTVRGLVVSDKMDKTIVVEVEERVKHARYVKVTTKTSKFKAHDEDNSAGIGDRVLVMETRPTSATKRWRLVEIIERAK